MALIPENVLGKIQQRIESKFPEMKGVTPQENKIRLKPEPEIYRKLGIAFPKTRAAKEFVELYYRTKVTTTDGFEIQRTVRVLADASGTVLKITTSK
jgi:hypothetical protein